VNRFSKNRAELEDKRLGRIPEKFPPRKNS
jgi:hypothetical protein